MIPPKEKKNIGTKTVTDGIAIQESQETTGHVLAFEDPGGATLEPVQSVLTDCNSLKRSMFRRRGLRRALIPVQMHTSPGQEGRGGKTWKQSNV